MNNGITTLQLTVLMAAYCGSKDFDTFKDTEIYRRQVTYLINQDMITLDSPDANYRYKLTDKGRYWYEYILAVPFPTPVNTFKIEVNK